MAAMQNAFKAQTDRGTKHKALLEGVVCGQKASGRSRFNTHVVREIDEQYGVLSRMMSGGEV